MDTLLVAISDRVQSYLKINKMVQKDIKHNVYFKKSVQ